MLLEVNFFGSKYIEVFEGWGGSNFEIRTLSSVMNLFILDILTCLFFLYFMNCLLLIFMTIINN